MKTLASIISFIIGFTSSFILICSTSGASGNEIFKFIGTAFVFGCIFVDKYKIQLDIEKLKEEIKNLKDK